MLTVSVFHIQSAGKRTHCKHSCIMLLTGTCALLALFAVSKQAKRQTVCYKNKTPACHTQNEQGLCSHPILHMQNDSRQCVDQEPTQLQPAGHLQCFWRDSAWEAFWEQETRHNKLLSSSRSVYASLTMDSASDIDKLLQAKQAQMCVLKQELAAKRGSNLALIDSNRALRQEAAKLQQQLCELQARQVMHSSRLPPQSQPNKHLVQLSALHEQYDKNQAALTSLQHELAVLDTIPEGAVGRVVAGDTLLDELQASEQQLAAELDGLKQEAAQDQEAITALLSEISHMQSLGSTNSREASLEAELQEAQQLTEALQDRLAEWGISNGCSLQPGGVNACEDQGNGGVELAGEVSSTSSSAESFTGPGPRTPPALQSDEGSDDGCP